MNIETPNIGLILGQHSSIEVQSVYQEIDRQGNIPVILDTRQIPNGVNIEFHANKRIMNLTVNQQSFSTCQVAGIFWASVAPPDVVPAHKNSSEFLSKVITNPTLDCACLMQLLFAMENVNWVNSFQAIQFHRTKPIQLMLASSLGASVPATYIGNNIRSIDMFLKQHQQSIVKPIFAGGHTRLIRPDLMHTNKINFWASQPFTLQSYIPGENIRTYIVGQFMISGRIEEKYAQDKPDGISDYREADSVSLIPVQIPIHIQQLAIRIMRAFHMQYTAIDWRLKPDGEYVFLEANPAPLFVNAQSQLNVDLTRAIVDLMFV